jgi:biofilm protein TabA
VMSQEYISKLPEQGKWEAHRRYIDLQYVALGTERIGYAHLSRLTQGDYNPDKDFQALSGDGDFVILSAGDFMLLFPEDAHMPGMAVGDPVQVKKVVVKIAISPQE